MKTNQIKEEKGVALVIAMLLLLASTLIGMSAVNTTIYDNLIAGNKRASEQAFYVAEAGIHELLGRFNSDATSAVIPETANPNNPETIPPWKILLATNSGKGATTINYGLNVPNAISISSLQTQLDFGVEVKHKVDGANPANIIKYSQKPVYIAKSYGFTPEGGRKEIEVEFIKKSDYFFDPPAALYSERPVHVHGSSTTINGMDQCQDPSKITNKPGIIVTSLISPSINISGNPIIGGSPPTQTPSSIPPPVNLSIKDMLDYLKNFTDFKYSYPNLGEIPANWGTVIAMNTETPITYTGPMNIVYFDMQGTNTLSLSGKSGAGILLVNGDLSLHGGFTWYGIIIVTGGMQYAGGGQKNVTGGIMTGETAIVEVDIGGNAGILYCSKVKDSLKIQNKVPPFKLIRWKDVF